MEQVGQRQAILCGKMCIDISIAPDFYFIQGGVLGMVSEGPSLLVD